MEIGVDSFASAMYGTNEKNALNPVDAMEQLLERMELADQAGLDVFGGGLEEVGLVHKFFILLLAKSMGTVLVVVLVCTVTCTVIEAVEAGGMTPRIGLGVKC